LWKGQKPTSKADTEEAKTSTSKSWCEVATESAISKIATNPLGKKTD